MLSSKAFNKILQNFGKIFNNMSQSSLASVQQFHHLQEEALKENCILVDENDNSLGGSSKKECHQVNPNGKVKLHRAFSVFLFNSNREMLVQRRSVHKVKTFDFLLFI